MLPDEHTYTCEACGGVFRSDRSDEESNAEAKGIFGVDDAAEKHRAGDMAVVCHDCFEAMARYFAER